MLYEVITFIGRKKYITLFGGEPLLNTPSKKKAIQYILDKSNDRNLEVAVVTNGYTLLDYIDVLKTAKIREVQITMRNNFV